MNKENISIIIPALNEGAGIGKTLSVLRGDGNKDIEIILVDGGSHDDTVQEARPCCQRVLETPRGRARQMNAGAAAASGEILFFLHADSHPPTGYANMIRTALREPDTVAGAFDLNISGRGHAYRLIERVANLRSRLTRVPYGDQGLFMRRSTFQAMGGFREIPIMEDIEMGRRLRRMGGIAFMHPPIRTSARRWQQEGVIRATMRNWSLIMAYTIFGISPERLAMHYRAHAPAGQADDDAGDSR